MSYYNRDPLLLTPVRSASRGTSVGTLATAFAVGGAVALLALGGTRARRASTSANVSGLQTAPR